MFSRKAYRWTIVILSLIVLAEGLCIVLMKNAQPEAFPAGGYEKEILNKYPSAMENGDISVYLQPIIEPYGETVCGAEALSRWYDGEEYISPADFIPVLEDSGDIRDYDEFVFRTVCSYQAELMDGGAEPFPISVNLSALSAQEDGAAEKYRAIMEEYNLSPGCINIEITESVELDPAELERIAGEFRSEGFTLEMDDFGAGYANFAVLSFVPYDILKLDKSLSDGAGSDRGEIILSETIEMGKRLGMYIIAEGVETQEQVIYLKGAGCDAIQGYYYSKPLPWEEFKAYLERRKPAEQ